MKTKRKPKAFLDMTDAERERAVAKFDREFIIDDARPLTPAERRRWARIQRKGDGSSRGAQVVSVAIDSDLLETADRLARKKRISRERLMERGLRALLAAEGLPVPAPRTVASRNP